MTDAFEKDFKDFLENLELRCTRARDSQFECAGNWDKANRRLGLLAVVFGVVGGGSAAGSATLGTSWSIPLVAVLSTMAGMLAAANTFLKPSDREKAHKQAGDGWSSLRDRVKKLGELDCCPTRTHESLLEDLDKLLEEKRKVTESSPVIPTRIYNKVARRLDKEKRKAEARVRAA